MNPKETYLVKDIRRQQFYLIYDEVQITGASGSVKVFTNITNKGNHQTNMSKGTELPSREEFRMLALSVIPRFGTPSTDLNLFYNWTALEFKINQKSVFQGPMCVFTSGCGLEGVSGFNGTGFAAGEGGEHHNGIADPSAILRFPEPFPIGELEGFSAEVKTDTAFSPSGSFYVKFVMHGIIFTVVQ